MNTRSKRIMSITLATLITAGSTGIYAANFKDVPDKHWAKQYIDRCEENGLFRGYDDGTFKPSTGVSKLQALVTLARTLDVGQSELTKAIQKHKAELVKYKVPEWAIGDMSIALSRGITDEKMLPTLFDKKGIEIMGNREDLAVLLVNTMGLQKEVKDKGVITKLPFVDAAQVTKAKMPHVLVIKEKGIMKGDERKNFNPKQTITRAEMATVLDATYKYIKNGGKPTPEKPKPEPEKPTPEKPKPEPEKPTPEKPAPEKPKPEPEKPKLKIVLGTTHSTFTSSGENYLIVDTVTGERKSYKVDNKSVLKLDGKVIAFKDLIAGLNIKMEVSGEDADTQGTIVSLTGDSIVESFKGSIFEIRDTGSKTLTLVYTENGIENKKFAVVNEDAIITLDGQKASFKDIKERDKASIQVVNGKVTKIDAESTTRTWSGELREVDLVNRSIAIQTADGTRTLYGLTKNAVIIRNNKEADLSALRAGDKIDISVENNLVTRIDAKVVMKEVTGLVQRTSIGYNRQEITILNNETKKEETYQIPTLADVSLDGQNVKLENFRLGYFTTIKLENNEVVKVEGQSVVTNKHLGKITSKDQGSISILLENGKTLNIDLLPSTFYKDDSGRQVSLYEINSGDTVLVTGDMYQGRVTANEVMKIK